eukprot:gnl/MRDRNA2_/MRDRNA2_117094_c0_seq1.p1 gnl/MRDRNA2_/MRDRNA2_117094_c0~~gnl/MRDRNA2_/MRDRNA2_117094_c0_seq1.p1  ORF type:complete len:156 (-),score=24.22 gnl/MRDRNA2_/MRDRNA2_117094_c0_seq1:188-655(-)
MAPRSGVYCASVRCRAGHLMEEISRREIDKDEVLLDCEVCGDQINAHTLSFAIAGAKRAGKSVASIVVFRCRSCDAGLCWNCREEHEIDPEPEVLCDPRHNSWLSEDICGESKPMVSKRPSESGSTDEDVEEMMEYFLGRSEKKQESKGSWCVLL